MPLSRIMNSPNWLILPISTFLLLLAAGCEKKGDVPKNSTSQGSATDKSGRTGSDQPPFFQDVTDLAGLDFQHAVGTPGKYHFPDIMVAGCGVIDYDRDGLLDLLLVDSGDLDTVFSGQRTNRGTRRNRLYRQHPAGKFTDVTGQVKLSALGYGCGVAIGDVNNDGYDDLYFCNFGEDRLFLNEQGSSFREVTRDANLRNSSWGSSATFFDFDGDGRLDLFVTNYVSYIAETNCANAGDPEDYCSPRVFEGTVDKLYRNLSAAGKIRFQDVTREMGIAEKKGPGLGVIARDFNGDGFPDLYVANDGHENFLWINDSGKGFSEEAGQRGCAMGLKGQAQAGMGIAAEDVDGNGVLDIVVTHLSGETNATYLGNLTADSNLFFVESASSRGVQRISRPMTGFGIGLPDLDNDGDVDMLTVNGRVTRRNRQPADDFWSDYAERNQISLSRDGKFEEYFSDGDGYLADVGVSRGLCLLDFDNDGRMDCLVTNTSGRARLYRNVYGSSLNWVGVRAVLPAEGGRVALGAEIELVTEGGPVRKKIVHSDGSYQSAGDTRVHFGIASADTILEIRVRWPDQKLEAFDTIEINTYQTLAKGSGRMLQ